MLDDSRLTITDDEFHQLRTFIHAHSGIALRAQAGAGMFALAKRLRHHGLPRYADYYELLTEGDPEGQERVAMINAITTNKTDFSVNRITSVFWPKRYFRRTAQSEPSAANTFRAPRRRPEKRPIRSP